MKFVKPTVSISSVAQGYGIVILENQLLRLSYTVTNNMAAPKKYNVIDINNLTGVAYYACKYLYKYNKCRNISFLDVYEDKTYVYIEAKLEGHEEERLFTYRCKCEIKRIIAKAGRTSWDQSILEASSIMEKRYRNGKNYVYDSKDTNIDAVFPIDDSVMDIVSPMNAKDNTNGNTPPMPFYIQQKYDGIRLLMYISKTRGTKVKEGMYINLITRGGKNINSLLLKYIADDICNLPGGEYILDGELYNNDISSSTLNGIIHAHEDNNKKYIKYVIFDIYIKDMSFEDRWNVIYEQIKPRTTGKLKVAKTILCRTVEYYNSILTECQVSGMEGIIIRKVNGMYIPGSRTNNVLKVKIYYIEDYTVRDVVEGNDAEAGLAIFIIKHEGLCLKVRPALSATQRKYFYKYPQEIIGKNIKVKYYGIMEKGGLRHPTMYSL